MFVIVCSYSAELVWKMLLRVRDGVCAIEDTSVTKFEKELRLCKCCVESSDGRRCEFSRGLVEKDFEEIAVFIDRAITIAAEFKKANPDDKLKDFKTRIVEVSSKPSNLKQFLESLFAFV